jgi:hypothetical protein
MRMNLQLPFCDSGNMISPLPSRGPFLLQSRNPTSSAYIRACLSLTATHEPTNDFGFLQLAQKDNLKEYIGHWQSERIGSIVPFAPEPSLSSI